MRASSPPRATAAGRAPDVGLRCRPGARRASGIAGEDTASAEPSPEQTPSRPPPPPDHPANRTDPARTPGPRCRRLAPPGRGRLGRVRRDRIGFAYLKATEGSTFTDPRFLTGARAARSAGLRVGGYHYFSLCSPGAPQAEHFARVLDSAPARSMPPAIDLELLGNCSDPPPRPELLDEVRAFIDVVERRTGQQVVVYAYPEFEARYRFAAALDRRQWVRRIGSTPPTRDWCIWQKDDQAIIDGISGPADLNVMAPDDSSLSEHPRGRGVRRLARGSNGAAPPVPDRRPDLADLRWCGTCCGHDRRCPSRAGDARRSRRGRAPDRPVHAGFRSDRLPCRSTTPNEPGDGMG